MQKIVHQNITQQVIGYMKENIESGNWKVGEKIPSEHELTALLGVSRSSIRQAVSHFAGIGVLESVHGKGTYLVDDEVEEQSNKNKITAEDCRNVEKVLEFRRIIESEACFLAARNSTPKLVEKLKKISGNHGPEPGRYRKICLCRYQLSSGHLSRIGESAFGEKYEPYFSGK